MRAQGSESKDDQKLPEDIGKEAAWRLLEEIWSGGCVDSFSQQYILLFMALASRDVSKIVLGPLTNHTMYFLRHLKDYFQVTFKIDEYKQDSFSDNDNFKTGSNKLLLTCIGIGYNNVAKRQI